MKIKIKHECKEKVQDTRRIRYYSLQTLKKSKLHFTKTKKKYKGEKSNGIITIEAR